MTSSSLYSNIRDSMDSGQTDAIQTRVEVNQRALIDKILARYASANAVYRELLQNSNDANATRAEVYFTINPEDNIVTMVQYRNNGMVFRKQDWSRLQKIAEGNPDPSKVGAFGVGAYSMFSICEEPMVISGNQALAFLWKGDALWSKVITNKESNGEWTTFCLPSRDPYTLPNLVEFGQFLCANLTFTQSLKQVSLFVNDELRLKIVKTTIQEPQLVKTPKASSWWKSDGAQTSTNLFSLQSGHIYESRQEIKVWVKGCAESKITARYVSGKAKTSIPSDLARRMERVTKKSPPPFVTVQIVLADDSSAAVTSSDAAAQITASFSPQLGGRGRVFIGFRTSQTTGLAAHLQAPLIPTVEREAIDLQDATLKVYNGELLQICGIVLRLTLEHAMVQIGQEYLDHKEERDVLEKQLKQEAEEEERKKKNKAEVKAEEEEEEEDDEPPPTNTKSSILSFAKYMAKGVKKQLVNVITTAGSLIDDGSSSLLNPRDLLPLSKEEKLAISLMQAFCPQQSTPDSQVGTALAMGFSNCLPHSTPPVLTKLGVSREGKLPHLGMEQFVPQSHVIRNVVYQNAQEYHDVLCQCRKLTMEDLLEALKSQVFDNEDQAIRVSQWWVKFMARESRYASRTMAVKESIRFMRKDEVVDAFSNYRYHVSNSTLKDLPVPKTVLPRDLQEAMRTLPRGWFTDLEVDNLTWLDFIAQHPCLTQGQPEDEQTRLKVIGLLCKEWRNKSPQEKTMFGYKLKNMLQDKRCLPFDSSEPTQFAAERPGDLYLHSAELQAFAGLGGSQAFQKVSQSVKNVGVTDDFLVLLGVRKSVAIDFLFTNLDSLQWSDDPKPLVEYLRSATLTRDDMSKLQTTQYLPAENDVSRTFAPRELHLPSDAALRLFPHVKLLQWPSDDELTPTSANGKFLVKLGIKTQPELLPLLQYISKDVKDEQVRVQCLEYVAKKLGGSSVYERPFQLLRAATLSSLKIMPCLVQDVFGSQQSSELQSPLHCYSDPSCLVMGFSVVNPKYESSINATRFRVPHEPDVDLVLSQMMHLVSTAKAKFTLSGVKRATENKVVLKAFDKIFSYMSHRSTDFSKGAMQALKKQQFIPCLSDDGVIEWFEPDNVYFRTQNDDNKDNLTASLFHVIDFSPFLSTAGVKSEATTADLFRLMLEDAESLLAKLGGSEEKYRALLRRIASDPPFRRVTPQISSRPFLLAYKPTDSDDEEKKEKQSYLLAKAEDIYLIDNSYFGRMFPVLRAPQESDLEHFYELLGSPYISKSVHKTFQVIGGASSGTPLVAQLSERLEERRPLLVSPSVTSRPLVNNASKAIDSSKLKLFQVDNLKAVYSLKNAGVRNQRVTCCAKTLAGGKNGLYVTANFDWFDVGYAIGGLILKRCQLEDAFFIGSLLEAPLEQLRSRGFPVDRIILTPPEPAPKPPPRVVVPPAAASSRGGSAASEPSIPGPSSNQAINADVNGSSPEKSSPQKDTRLEGLAAHFMQMFPGCDEKYLRKMLGDNPSMETIQRVAAEMTEKGYPKQSASQPNDVKQDEPESFLPPDIANPEKQKKLGKRIGKALSGIRNNVGSMAPSVGSSGSRIRNAPPPSNGAVLNDGKPVPPAMDSSSLANMEQMLQSTVKESAKVNSKGVNSADTVMTQLPEGLSRDNEGCEVMPGHSLKPFSGPYRSGKTHNGVRVFSARQHPASETFLTENFHVVDSFADILQNLCGIYQLNLSSIAIFHDPTGGTIAFNANRALHFNVRFFFALHYASTSVGNSRECYAYWFTTMAHELAHHLVSAHNKEHGYYTESYVTLYLPKLVSLLTQLEVKAKGGGIKTPVRSKFG